MSKQLSIIILLFSFFSSNAQNKWENHVLNLKGDDTYRIAIDQQGKKWVGTSIGLSVFNDTSWKTFRTYNSGLVDDHIRDILVDAQNIKWFTTPSGGVAKLNDTTWTIYNKSNSGIADNWVYCVTEDLQNNKWFGTRSGLSKFDGTNWTTFNTNNSGLGSNTVSTAAVDKLGNLWVGVWQQGICKFDGINWTTYNVSNSGLAHNLPQRIAFDAQNNVWIATFNGVNKFDGINWTTYNTSNSGLLSNSAFDLGFDTQNNLWVATQAGGVSRFDGSNWTTYKTFNSSLLSDNVYALACDKQGGVWFGPNYSVSHYSGSNWKSYYCRDIGVASDYVLSLLKDYSGNVWAGTYGSGVSRYASNSWTRFYTLNSGLTNDWINKMTYDAQGNIWFCTDAGVSVFDGVNWTSYNSTNSPLPPWAAPTTGMGITSMAIDKLGNKWFGTNGNGVFKFDGSNWTNYESLNSGLISNNVTAIAIDSLDNKWIGTANSGLSVYDNNNWTTLPLVGRVSSINPDRDSAVWIGIDNPQNGGLYKFRGGTTTLYQQGSGLVSNEVTSIEIDSQDNKWIGTRGGLNKFNDTVWVSYTSANTNRGLISDLILNICVGADNRVWVCSPIGISILTENALQPTSIKQTKFNGFSNLVLTPTYASRYITVETTRSNTPLYIVNASGSIVKTVYSQSPQTHIDISNLSNGVYICTYKGCWSKFFKD